MSSKNVTSTNIINNSVLSCAVANGEIRSTEFTTVTVNGDLVVDNRSILKEIDELKDSLGLLKRCFNLEARYPKLKELAEEYNTQLEKYKTFERLR